MRPLEEVFSRGGVERRRGQQPREDSEAAEDGESHRRRLRQGRAWRRCWLDRSWGAGLRVDVRVP